MRVGPHAAGRGSISRRDLLAAAVLGGIVPAQVQARVAAGPVHNLLVQLRWVDAAGPFAAGTVTIGTRRASAEAGPIQRITVLNGHSARVDLVERHPLEWVDTAVRLDTPASAVGPHVFAAPHAGQEAQVRSLVVAVAWAGGRSPVQVELAVDLPEDDAAATRRVASTVLAELGTWVTVAHHGPAAAAVGTGPTWSTSAAGGRDLQLCVTLAP